MPWQVAQYGLPAAGVLSLALLNFTVVQTISHSRSKIVQALSVLVAEVGTGAWIQVGDPNFALFSRATRTIQSLLDSLLVARPSDVPRGLRNSFVDGWDVHTSSQPWEFELDFWANLAEHPNLLS